MRCYNCKNSKLKRVDKDFSCIKMPQCHIEDFKRYELNQSFKIKVGIKSDLKVKNIFGK